ncbi:hypothetical protein BJ508DRAFT_364982 [Ascobolus immersus RN42]|uniref:Uncharacterized protein n=1 Tax=Ascobolus immersus RN42 TaxID=1160509 RepID=A0A3N4HS77_ASCIM|nr:hypothetical protein BJ508DRAFT_364982 [Ascobolus immersus RN42]
MFTDDINKNPYLTVNRCPFPYKILRRLSLLSLQNIASYFLRILYDQSSSQPQRTWNSTSPPEEDELESRSLDVVHLERRIKALEVDNTLSQDLKSVLEDRKAEINLSEKLDQLIERDDRIEELFALRASDLEKLAAVNESFLQEMVLMKKEIAKLQASQQQQRSNSGPSHESSGSATCQS